MPTPTGNWENLQALIEDSHYLLTD